jgi:hypothetical protein
LFDISTPFFEPVSGQTYMLKLHVETSLTKKAQYGILLRLLISIKAAGQRQRKTGPINKTVTMPGSPCCFTLPLKAWSSWVKNRTARGAVE